MHARCCLGTLLKDAIACSCYKELANSSEKHVLNMVSGSPKAQTQVHMLRIMCIYACAAQCTQHCRAAVLSEFPDSLLRLSHLCPQPDCSDVPDALPIGMLPACPAAFWPQTATPELTLPALSLASSEG